MVLLKRGKVLRQQMQGAPAGRPGLHRFDHRALTQWPIGEVRIAPHHLHPALGCSGSDGLSNQINERTATQYAPLGQRGGIESLVSGWIHETSLADLCKGQVRSGSVSCSQPASNQSCSNASAAALALRTSLAASCRWSA